MTAMWRALNQRGLRRVSIINIKLSTPIFGLPMIVYEYHEIYIRSRYSTRVHNERLE